MRADLVAKSYLETPWRHQGRVKGAQGGIDCIGLVVEVAREMGVVQRGWDVRGYSRVPDGETLARHLRARLVEVEKNEMRPGDVVLVAISRHPQHVGIVGEYPHGGLSLIHAASVWGRVVEHRLVFSSSMRFVAAFRFPEA